MRRNLPGSGNRHGSCEKKTAAVARIPDAFGDICAPRKPRSIKRILHKESGVKSLRAKLCREALAPEDTGVRASRIVSNELIADPLITVDVRDVRPGDDRNFRA